MLIRKNFVHEPSEGFTCLTPSRTQAQFKDECDVNNILRNYVSTGVLTHTNEREALYGDFSEVPQDYGEALAVVEEAKAKFDALPSEVRHRFDSDPLKMVQFLQDEKNREEAIKLGLVNKPAVEDSKDSDDIVSN